ncbi:hypothetical protein TRVA0_117S00100 [Trichomonascus vanleenenianus]|uniref:uncharacterized protein n=1 Tax=Trichomonascus vanleenenianus TaxID=2268995 RepID=UPI003EC96F52
MDFDGFPPKPGYSARLGAGWEFTMVKIGSLLWGGGEIYYGEGWEFTMGVGGSLLWRGARVGSEFTILLSRTSSKNWPKNLLGIWHSSQNIRHVSHTSYRPTRI